MLYDTVTPHHTIRTRDGRWWRTTGRNGCRRDMLLAVQIVDGRETERERIVMVQDVEWVEPVRQMELMEDAQ